MRTIVEPIYKTRFGVFDEVTIVRQWPVDCAFIQDKLDRPDTTLVVGVEISGKSGKGYLEQPFYWALILLRGERVPKQAFLRKELRNEGVPVAHVVLAF